MAASPEPVRRQSRYARRSSVPAVPLTSNMLTLLDAVGLLGYITQKQAAPLTGLTPRQVRRSFRAALDAGYVEVVPVPRSVFSPLDASVLGGSAPNVYVLTKAGLRILHEHSLSEIPPPPDWRDRKFLFLAHTLAIGEVRGWLTRCARLHPGHEVVTWRDQAGAAIELSLPGAPRVVRPDAWFVYRLGGPVLVGLLEVDRGTERLSGSRWEQKVAGYRSLYASGRLKEVTGYANARVLVFTLTTKRRDDLAEYLKSHAPAGLHERFWLTDGETLGESDLTAPRWRQPAEATLRPLLESARMDGQ